MCAEAISLGKYLRLGNGEDSTGGRLRASITSDAMEALIGAIYLDGGFACSLSSFFFAAALRRLNFTIPAVSSNSSRRSSGLPLKILSI